MRNTETKLSLHAAMRYCHDCTRSAVGTGVARTIDVCLLKIVEKYKISSGDRRGAYGRRLLVENS